MQSLISKVQEAMPKYDVPKVEIYNLDNIAQMPTEHITTSYLLYRILGNDSQAIFVSPTGGVADEYYMKPVSQLHTDTVESGGSFVGEDAQGKYLFKHTNEDTKRAYLFKVPEFREELISSGWAIFPEIDKLSESEARNLGIQDTQFINNFYKRRISLKQLVQTVERTNWSEKDYNLALNDLKELTNLGDEMFLVYQTNGSWGRGRSFYMPVKHKEESIILELDEFDSSPLVSEKGNNTLTRNASIILDYRSDTLNNNAKERIGTLTREYIENEKLTGYSRSTEKSDGLIIRISDRKYGDILPVPNTLAFLDRVIALKEFAELAIKIEKSEISSKQEKVLQLRRNQLGLDSIVKTK